MRSATEVRRARLLLDPAGMEEVLARALGSRPGRGSVAYLLDAKLQPERQCVALYDYRGGYVTAVMPLSSGSALSRAVGAIVDPKTGVRLFPFPLDPALPGLAAAADPRAMARLVEDLLRERGFDGWVRSCRVTPVRYRPCQRCTLRVEVSLGTRRGRPARRTYFAKVFDDPGELETVHSAMHELSGVGLWPGRVGVAVPLGRARGTRILLQQGVRGITLERLLTRRDGPAAVEVEQAQRLVHRCATGIAAIHRSAVRVRRRRNLVEEVRELSQWAGAVRLVAPELSAAMGRLVEALLDRAEVVEEQAGSCFTHGDFKPNQILVDGERLTFLDFDGCAMSDRALDVATFLSTLRQYAAREAADGSDAESRGDLFRALEEAFLRRYCSLIGAGAAFQRRVTWCKAVASLRKALRAFYRDPESTVPVALVAEARQWTRALRA